MNLDQGMVISGPASVDQIEIDEVLDISYYQLEIAADGAGWNDLWLSLNDERCGGRFHDVQLSGRNEDV